jgi:hypothetical protein
MFQSREKASQKYSEIIVKKLETTALDAVVFYYGKIHASADEYSGAFCHTVDRIIKKEKKMTSQFQAIQREVPNTGSESAWKSLYKTGPVVDQAALHGLLKRVRDSGMPLISVSPVEHGSSTTLPLRGLRGTGQADQSDVK